MIFTENYLSSSMVMDILLALLALACALKAHKDGFAASAVRLAGKFARLFAGFFAADRYSPLIFEKIRPSLVERVMEYFEGAGRTVSAGEAFSGIMDGWPSLFLSSTAGNSGASFPDFVLADEEGARRIVDLLMAPAFTNVIRAVIFVVCFVAISALCVFLANTLKIVNDVPLVGSFNRSFGLLLGFASGCLNIILLSFLLSIIVIVSRDSLPFLNSRTLAGSKILALTGALNPFLP